MRNFVFLIFVACIWLVSGLKNDPCVRAPCAFGQICIPKDTAYFCAEENVVRAIQNAMKHKMFVQSTNNVQRDGFLIGSGGDMDSQKQQNEMTKNTINFLSSISSPLARIQQQADGSLEKENFGNTRTGILSEAIDPKPKSNGNVRTSVLTNTNDKQQKFGNMRTAILTNSVDSRMFEGADDMQRGNSKKLMENMDKPKRIHSKFPSPNKVLSREQQQQQQFVFENNKFPTVQRINQNNFGLGVSVNEKLMNKNLQKDENNVEEDHDFETTTASTTTTTTTSAPVVPLEPFCNGRKFGDEIPHPNDVRKFIVCLHKGEYSIMNCPGKLKYNRYKGRCDHSDLKPAPACLSNPCQNNGTCLDTVDYDFLCDCPGGFSGETCEKGSGACSTNPCGIHGLCYSISTTVKGFSYYCSCDNGRTYGLDCELRKYLNPCDPEVTEAYFPSKLSKNLFIHCENDMMNLRPCNPPLVWSQDLLTCVFE